MSNIRRIVLFFCVVVFSCCNSDNSELSKNDINTIYNAITELVSKEKRLNNSFLVNPRLAPFEFHPYFIENGSSSHNDKMKNKILKTLGWNQAEFDLKKKEINTKYSHKVFSELTELSKLDSSNWVLSFSRLDKNIVFLELTRLCSKVSKNELADKSFIDSINKAEICSLAFITKDNKVVEMIPINCVHTEKCIEAIE